MQREPTSPRVDDDGDASSSPSSSASSLETSPALPKRHFPLELSRSSHTPPGSHPFGVPGDNSEFFSALTAAAATRFGDAENVGKPAEEHPPAGKVEDVDGVSALSEEVEHEMGALSLDMPIESDCDLNRRIRLEGPNGESFFSVVSPFDNKVHYRPRLPLESYTSAQLSESDIVFSKEYAQLNLTCRVLSMALDPNVPLLDRFKFLCLVSFYLDEHFSKRLGHFPRLDPRDLESATINLRRQVRPPTKYEEELTLALRTIVDKQHECLSKHLLPRLTHHGVEIVKGESLTPGEAQRMTAHFKEHLRPALTPILLDPTHPFPLIQSHDIYLYVYVHNQRTRCKRKILFRIPSDQRLIPLDDSRLRFVAAEDICLANLDLVCHSMTVLAAHPFRATRNTKISIEDDAFEGMHNLFDFIVDEVHRRRQAPATRLEVVKTAPKAMVEHLKNELYLDDMDVYFVDTPLLDLSSCLPLAFIALPWLRQTMRDPVVPAPFRGLTERLRTDPGAIFGVLRKKDVLVEYPRDNFENSAVLYLHAAARDPAVRSIKTVIYRGGSDSPIIAALIRAAKNGKEVSVVVELKASLDEIQNSEYARTLQLAGCNVTYGVMGLKVHSKIMLVVRQERDGKLRSYVNISTGNFNPKTAKLYTDYSLFTCREDICTDVLDVFNSLTGYSWKPEFRTLLVSPINMLSRFIEMIREEAENARAGKPARIVAQMNGLTDKEITKELYDASQAGVRIDLIVRGPCRLRPGIKGRSENIRVYSWVGQLLQHRRVFYFHANGAAKYFIGSADWRTRNLTARVEVIVPVHDRDVRKKLAKAFDLINDEQWVWQMAPDGRYYKGMPSHSPPVSLSITPAQSAESGDPRTKVRVEKEDPGDVSLARPSRSPHQAMLDMMYDDRQKLSASRTKKLPSSISDTTDDDSSSGKRSKPKFQVDVKGNKRMVDKIAVGAIPIRFVDDVESIETMRVLMVARGDDDPWAVPKGGTNEGETVQQATVRIAREKAGVSRCEQIANLGWILVSKRTKQIAVQTFVLLAKELGTFASMRKDRRRRWVPIEEAITMLKTEMHDFSLNALERAFGVFRGMYADRAESGSAHHQYVSTTPVTKSVGDSAPSSPPQEGAGGSGAASTEGNAESAEISVKH